MREYNCGLILELKSNDTIELSDDEIGKIFMISVQALLDKRLELGKEFNIRDLDYSTDSKIVNLVGILQKQNMDMIDKLHKYDIERPIKNNGPFSPW